MTRTRRPFPRPVVVVAAFVLGAVLAPASWTPRVVAGLLPIAIPDTHTMKHDTTATVPAPGVLGNDLDLLGGATAILTAQPTHGTVNLRSDGGYTYVPVAHYVGTDVFRYRPSGLLGTGTTVTITITNAAPVAVNNSYTAVTGQTLSVAAPGVLANDADADGDALTATKVTDSGSGSVNLSSNGGFTFTSGGSFTGLRTFTYRVSDGIAWSGTATVSIQVNAPPPTPTPAPTPRPTPTPSPTLPPTPTLPPVSTLPPPPTLPPIATLPPLPTVLPTPRPTASTGSSASPGASPGPSSRPIGSASPSPTDSSARGEPTTVDGSPAPSSTPVTGTIGSVGGDPGGGPSLTGSGFSVGGGTVAPFGLGDVGLAAFGSLEWAVPALAMTVPGLLLMLAVLAQLSTGVVWLPVVRRWLGGFGVGRRRRRPNTG